MGIILLKYKYTEYKYHLDNLGTLIKWILSFFGSGLWGPKAYSLWGGVVPSPRIGYEYL